MRLPAHPHAATGPANPFIVPLGLPLFPCYTEIDGLGLFKELQDVKTCVHSRFWKSVTELYFIWEFGAQKFCWHISGRKKKTSFMKLHGVV